LNIPTADYQKVAGISTSISAFTGLFVNFIIGIIYDILGRRRPVLVSLVIGMVGMFWYPFLKNAVELYIASDLLIPLQVVLNCPFIPDLIEE
jgi:MFS family permease